MDVLQTQINNLQSLIIKLNKRNSAYSDRINELNTTIDRLKIVTDTDKKLKEQYYGLISNYENEITTNNNKIREMEIQIDELVAEKERNASPEELEKLIESEVPTPVSPSVISEDVQGQETARIAAEQAAEQARIEEESRIAAEQSRIAAEDAENAEILAAEQKMRKNAVKKMIEEEKEKKKNKKSLKKKLRKPYKIKASDEYTRKIEKKQSNKIAIGKRFRTTITQTKKMFQPIPQNSNIICKAILKSGKNITKKKYYFPSQFPNLTKLKPIVKG